MKNMANEFKEFINRGNLVELAIAFILAAAFAPVVLAIVDGIFMPIIAAIVGIAELPAERKQELAARAASTPMARKRT